MIAALIRYEAACRALAAARTVDEVAELRNKAEALRAYARQAKNRDLEVDAAEIRLRAERRLGELISAQKETIGLNPGALRRGSEREPRDGRPTLAEAGIDKKLSAQAQKLAAVPEERFEVLLGEWRERAAAENGRVSTTLVREGELAQRRADFAERTAEGCTVDDLHGLVAAGAKFGAIHADPAWQYLTRSPRGEGRSASAHYEVMTLGDMKALPIAALAAADCLLCMWIPDWAPRWALELVEAWGFEHKTTAFTWVKQNPSGEGWHMGSGYWTRANPETCWLATKGEPERLSPFDVRQLIVSPLGAHSVKPEEARERVERLVRGPYLDLFGRRQRPGWTVWSNEILRSDFVLPDAPGSHVEDDFLIPRFLGRSFSLRKAS